MNFKNWFLIESGFDVQIGKVIEIPGQEGRYPIHAQIISINGDKVWLRQISHNKPVPDVNDKEAGGQRFSMSRSAVNHFINDLTGKVELTNGKTDDQWINKVLSGQATYIGKGDDGVVFDAGEMIVKVSTTVPFQPTNTYHRTPSQAARMTFNNVRLTEKLRAAGVAGILPTYVKIVGDKAFMVRPKVEIKKQFSREELKEIQASIEAIHKAGYSINDEIQVGLWNGKMYHFDLGKMAQIGHKEDSTDDWERYDRLLSNSGYTRPEKEWEYLTSMLMFFSKDNVKDKVDEQKRREYIKRFMRQKKLMDKEYPERRDEIEKEFKQIIDYI